MYPTYSKRSEKSFTIPTEISEINPKLDEYDRQTWNLLFEVLENYGVELSKKKIEIIMTTYKCDILLDIIDCLFEIDNSSTGQISAAMKRKLDIKGTFGTERKSQALHNLLQNHQENDRPLSEIVSDGGKILQKSNKQNLQTERRGSAALPTNSIKVQRNSIKLQPLDSGDIQQSPFSVRNQIQNRQSSRGLNSSPQSRLLGKESTLVMDLNSNEVEEIMPTTLETCRTSVQFILTSLAIAFSMKSNQAATLLANNNKFLYHLCIKGAKGSDFDNVIKWYNLLLPNIDHLINLINTEKKDILSYGSGHIPIASKGYAVKENRSKILFKTLNILKGGFYSRKTEVQLACGSLFEVLIKNINQQNINLQDDIWEWFTTSTMIPEFKRPVKNVTINETKISVGEHLLKRDQNSQQGLDSSLSREFDSFGQQTGLQALIFAYQHNNQFLYIGCQLFLRFGQINSVELFTTRIQQNLPSWCSYASLCFDLFENTLDQTLAIQVLEQSGVLKYWVMSALNIAESTGELPLNDRIISLIFLTEIWRLKSNVVNINGSSDQIINILKRAARDMKRTLCVTSIELLFRLLQTFAYEKHQSAPTLYKALTFLLVEFYWELDVRELMLGHFIELFIKYDNIPINILCEPLLKQIEISQYHEASFNVFDFDFFNHIANHKKLTIATAVILIDCLSKIALSSVFYQLPSTKIITFLMKKFYQSYELFYHWKESLKDIVQTLFSMEAKLALHRQHIINEENNFFHRLALRNKKEEKSQSVIQKGRMSDLEFSQVKINQKLLVNLLEQLIRCQNQKINEELKIKLLDTYIAIQNTIKIDCQAIRYLLSFYTNKIDQLLEQRQATNPNSANQMLIPFIDELQQLQNESVGKSIHSPGAVDIYAQRQKQKNHQIQDEQKKNFSNHDSFALIPYQQTIVSVALPNNTIDKKNSKEPPSLLYDFRKWEEEWEIKQYTQFLKKHIKLYKELHKSYQNQNGVKKPIAVDRLTFTEAERTFDQISSQSLFKMIKDFKLDFGKAHINLKDDIIKIVKAINIYILKDQGAIDILTFEGFVHFILQYAYFIWNSSYPQLKSYFLVEKLFAQMSLQPKFQELGLFMNKIETTNRKEMQILQKIEHEILEEGEQTPQNHKRLQEKQQFIQYSVPDIVPMAQHKKICIEIMDDLIYKLFGTHFLEPIQKEHIITKVIPKIQAIKKGSMINQSPFVNPNPLPPKGIKANQPLSNSTYISAEQEMAKKNYESKFEKKPTMQNQTNVTEYTQSYKSDHAKAQFKAQALNKRAKEFGETMQLTIIKAPIEDKQVMFECAEVLNEIIKAVEDGKQALRLDFTPYKIYSLYKRKLQKPEEPIEEEQLNEEEEEEKRRKQQNIKEFLKEYKVKLHEEAENIKKKKKFDQVVAPQIEKKIKKKKYGQYLDFVDKLTKENEQETEIRVKQHEEELKRKKDEKNEAIAQQKELQKEFDRKHKKQIEEILEKRHNVEDKHKEKQEHSVKTVKVVTDRWAEIHKKKLREVKSIKQNARDKFFAYLKSAPIQEILNEKYRKGLYLKYKQCCKIGHKESGVTQNAWLDWIKQAYQKQGVKLNIDSKQLIKIHTTQVKEMVYMQDYTAFIKSKYQQESDLKVQVNDGIAIPDENELNYGAFVVALVKVANLIALREQEAKEKGPQYFGFKDNDEYQLSDQEGVDLEKLFQFLDVAVKSDKDWKLFKPKDQNYWYEKALEAQNQEKDISPYYRGTVAPVKAQSTTPKPPFSPRNDKTKDGKTTPIQKDLKQDTKTKPISPQQDKRSQTPQKRSSTPKKQQKVNDKSPDKPSDSVASKLFSIFGKKK